MEFWQHIYEKFDPVAFYIFNLPIHWYGIMYVLALLTALFFAEYLVKKDNLPISKKELESFFLYVEIGVILGARIGYVLFYDTHTKFYLTHPWQIFNPFVDGTFVGIRGMSYHGALIGFLVGAFLFAKRYKKNFWFLMDIVAVSAPLGYIFGRVGNFLNQELIGRETDVFCGIYVNGVLRHPSQLYEALFEGFVVFAILYFYRKRKRFEGELIIFYLFLYGIFRFFVEFFRAPDIQLGFICCGWMSMGQLLSLVMIFISIFLYFKLSKRRSYG